MKTKNKNQGFAIMEILLLLVTLGFIAAIAYVVLSHQKDTPVPQKAKVDLNKLLQVKEWGVYLELPDTSSKVSYKLSSGDPDDIILSSVPLDKLSSDHPECANANKFIHIDRSKSAPAQIENKQVGGYYYFNGVRPSVSPCIGTDIGLMQALSNQAYELYDKLPAYQNVILNP
jgi:hypothetical protein